jgi:hypothetical protein
VKRSPAATLWIVDDIDPHAEQTVRCLDDDSDALVRWMGDHPTKIVVAGRVQRIARRARDEGSMTVSNPDVAIGTGRRVSSPSHLLPTSYGGFMHGEYKTPGGKLIAVDFSVDDGTLRDVTVSGDFFLYPEEALSDLVASLEGISVELTESEIADRVRYGMRRSAELLGSSPEAIAAAVRRALASEDAARVESES